ncbi:MAG: hypothetical protein JWN70_3754 [Planctomycetaceae bacterium]|nr:hypothetical protein [Planctomycetaceae bacterium]
MPQLESLFTQSDRDAVNRAVKEAEALTSAEIIPVIAASSGRYDRAEDVVGLWTGVAALFAIWSLFPAVPDQANSWDSPSPVWQFTAYAVAVVVGFMVGAVVSSRVNVLRRLFTPAQQMRDEVSLRARGIFFDQRVHHTAGATGVLLYVSLFERMATVLADQSVVEKIGQSQIDELCRDFTQRLRVGRPTAAVCETIQEVGQRLATAMPRAEDDVNELADALIVLA